MPTEYGVFGLEVHRVYRHMPPEHDSSEQWLDWDSGEVLGYTLLHGAVFPTREFALEYLVKGLKETLSEARAEMARIAGIAGEWK